MYKPNPINTDDIKLSKELTELTEKIAENVHENWAAERMAQGWTYGAQRDDIKKHHPCLVPYGELSDEEKELDRRTAMETIKTIVAMGYRIHSECNDPEGKR